MATPDLQRLAEHVKRRRVGLNLSLKRAAAMAGMSKDTWLRVETGQPVRHISYDKIEAALSWTVGSCRKIMDGGEAVVVDHSDEVGFALVPVGDLADEVSQAVQGAMVAGTDLSAPKIREVNERVIELLRARGILPAAD